MEKPQVTSQTSEFGGLAKQLSPHKTPLGKAVTATNVRCQNVGQLDVRRGLANTSFANGTSAVNYAIIAMVRFPRPEAEYIVYEDANGAIHAGRTLSL